MTNRPVLSDAPREPYDLATERADYPAHDGPPNRSVVICSHPRSGSTLLGEAIHAAGGLGCPLEYLHRGFRPYFTRRWQADDLVSYVRALHRFRTDTSGVLSIKLFWRDVEELAVEARPDAPIVRREVVVEAPALSHLFGLLRTILPNPTFVYLTRQDRVRQAVSAYMAAETSVFRAFSREDDDRCSRRVEYRYDGILRQLAAADYGNARWRQFFAANGIEPHRIEFESLASAYQPTIGALLAHLGRPGTPPAPRLLRQATALSETFMRRFLHDHEAAPAAIGSRPCR